MQGTAGDWRARCRALTPAALAVGLGVASGSSWRAMSQGVPGTTGPTRWYVADRDRRELVALDDDLLVVRRLALPLPIELAARGDRGLWVACADGGSPLGSHALRRLAPDGTVEQVFAIGALIDLDVVEDDALLVDLVGGLRRVARIGASGALTVLSQSTDLNCAAGQSREVLIGSDSGGLELRDAASGTLLAARAFGGVIADVAPGPRAGTWWVLDAHGGPSVRRVALLDASLSTLWERAAGVAALHLVPVPRSERVWLADASGTSARRFGPGGNIELASVVLPVSGADRGVARSDGSVVFAAPGALVALHPDGSPASGQGGFDFLVDVERVERR